MIKLCSTLFEEGAVSILLKEEGDADVPPLRGISAGLSRLHTYRENPEWQGEQQEGKMRGFTYGQGDDGVRNG